MTAARHAVERVPHACARALERYGLKLTLADLVKITHRVQNNDCTTFISMEPSGATQWFLEYKGVKVRVLISADFYRVITFLPLHGDRPTRPRKRKRKKIYLGGKQRWIDAA